MSNSKLSPYKILGVEEGASISDCEKARRKLAKKYHPDLNPNDYLAEEAMKKINAAYDAIKSGKPLLYENDCNTHQNKSDSAQANSTKDNYTQSSKDYSEHKGDCKSNTSKTTSYQTNNTKTEYSQTDKTDSNGELFPYIIRIVLSGLLATGLICLLAKYSTIYFNSYDTWIDKFFELYDAKSKWWYLFDVQDSVFDLILPFVEYQNYIAILKNTGYIAVLTIVSTLVITIVINVIHFIVVYLSNNQRSPFVFHRTSIIKFVKITDLLYQIITYISLLICWVEVSLISVLLILKCLDFVSDSKTHIVFYYLAIIIYFLVSIVVLIVGISLKRNRCLSELKSFENIGTYSLGLLFTFIPFLVEVIIALALPVVLIIFLVIIILTIIIELGQLDYIVVIRSKW